MRHPAFNAMLVEPALRPELWRLVLGVGLVFLLWIGTSLLIIGAAAGIVAAQQGPFGVMPFFNALSLANQPGQVMLLLSTFAGLAIGALVAAAALHFRGAVSLFGDWEDWRRGFLTCLGVLVPVYGFALGVSFVLQPPIENLPIWQWLLLLPFVLPLVLLQTGAEEMFFRGYLMQQLAVRFAARWIWMGLPTVVFGLLHWSPEAGANLPLVLLAATVFGWVAADLTERTGSLGAAMGIHFGNNVAGLCLVASGESLTGVALYVSPVPLGELGPQSIGLLLSVGLLLIVWWLTKRQLDG